MEIVYATGEQIRLKITSKFYLNFFHKPNKSISQLQLVLIKYLCLLKQARNHSTIKKENKRRVWRRIKHINYKESHQIPEKVGVDQTILVMEESTSWTIIKYSATLTNKYSEQIEASNNLLHMTFHNLWRINLITCQTLQKEKTH